MNYLIAYDIEDNKRRKKISDELEAYGVRVNYSVFECTLNKTKLNKLVKKLEEIVDRKYDSIRFYNICQNCIPKSFDLCKKDDIFKYQELFV